MSKYSRYLQAAEQLRVNTGQWTAYESQGHCVVLAGPGSGKTKTLTTKMARMLEEDVPEPRGIACITYNNECARELESRLDALGIEPGGRVFIGTVHSFSLTQIILPYAKVAGLELPENFSVATRSEQREALVTAIARTRTKPEKPQNWEFRLGYYRRSILNRDSAEWRESDPELAALIEAYESELRRRGLIDFDDMPLLAVRALRANPWLQRAILAKYPILVVDEYQDLGLALHRMVMGLCFSTGIRLFAVGDVDQSIYGFTGARPDLLRRLSSREGVETVRLRLNYRSGNKIVAASRVALGEYRDYEAADSSAEGTVYVHPLVGTYERQAAHLIDELLPQVLERFPQLGYGDVAVLYPAAWIGDFVANAAQAVGISLIRIDSNALYPRSSRLMQWIELCAQWCCGGWKNGEPRFMRLIREGHRLFAETLCDDEKSMDFHRRLMSVLWEYRGADLMLYSWLEVLHDCVIEPFALESSTLNDEIEILATFAERIAPTGDRAKMVLGELAGNAQYLDRLTLSTLHSAKGREFGLVFMFGMDRGRLPRNGASQQQLAEARRLFYVGFTRAKNEVHLIHSANRSSQFVNEINDHLYNDN